MILYGGFHGHEGYPNSWMVYVYVMEDPGSKWMRTGGSPISGNLHMAITYSY